MVQNIFLTDHRREVLAGEADMTDGSLSVEKSRIRKRADMALQELIEVAESSEIENNTVFNPADIAHLLNAVMQPSDRPLTALYDYETTNPAERRRNHQDAYPYQYDLYYAFEALFLQWEQTLDQVTGPDEELRFVGPIIKSADE